VRPSSKIVVLIMIVTVGIVALAVYNWSAGDDGSENGQPPATGSTEEPKPLKPGAYLDAACDMPARWARLIYRGWAPGTTRDFDISIVPSPPNYMGTFINTSHSGPYDFLQKVPLVFYGPGFIKPLGHFEVDREATIADIAPTTAELLGLDFARPQSAPVTELLEKTTKRPKLIVTAVIDGGGWNVLEEHPDAWPNLARLIEEGANVDGAITGSSPSITPAVHTNIGTGSFPRQHGVTAIAVRADDGKMVGAFTPVDNEEGVGIVDPTINLRQQTVADLWDKATGNQAEIALVAPGNYQLGMIGYGRALPGADADIVTSLAKGPGVWSTNPKFYFAPAYVNTKVEGPEDDLRAADSADGATDESWRGRKFPGNIVATPALAPWENRIIQTIIEREGFGEDDITDIFQINYKSPDSLGHIYNMISPEEGDVLRSVDTALGELVTFLDDQVGEGNYVVIVTADHGQTPLKIGGWPISRSEIKDDVDRHFGINEEDLSLIEQTSASSFFMRRRQLKEHGVTPEQVADFLTGYTIGDNVAEGSEVPEGYEDRTEERIFSGVIPGRRLDKVAACTGAFDE
jgi:Type I phosphodiesterase / nucleotide pyrophosphatase